MLGILQEFNKTFPVKGKVYGWRGKLFSRIMIYIPGNTVITENDKSDRLKFLFELSHNITSILFCHSFSDFLDKEIWIDKFTFSFDSFI